MTGNPRARMLVVGVLLALFGATPQVATACTAFLLTQNGSRVMGKSYDWHTAYGLLIANQRGVLKTAMVAPGPSAAKWTSRYGSLTFNQYGRELPLGGINEAGVAIEVLWYGGTQLPALDPKKPTLNELQLIQYLLDTSGDLPQLLTNLKRVQVQRAYAPVHYFACDAAGRCAAIEYTDGKLTINGDQHLAEPVLTNHGYTYSRLMLMAYKVFDRVARGQSSIDRFVRIARHLGAKSQVDAVTRAFQLLASVRTGSYTKWQIVYDLTNKVVHFRLPAETRILHVRVGGQMFECGSPVRTLDLFGSVDPLRRQVWQTWREELNARLIRQSFSRLSNPLPDKVLRQLIAYPRTTRCAPKR